VNDDYELDHPTWVVVGGLLIALTALTALFAFLIAAGGLNRTAATVARAASAALVAVLLPTHFVFGLVDIESGSRDDDLEVWMSGSWVLLLGSLSCCWIANFLREQFDR